MDTLSITQWQFIRAFNLKDTCNTVANCLTNNLQLTHPCWQCKIFSINSNATLFVNTASKSTTELDLLQDGDCVETIFTPWYKLQPVVIRNTIQDLNSMLYKGRMKSSIHTYIHNKSYSAHSYMKPTLLSNSQVSISLVIHGLCWNVSGRIKVHVVQICTNGALPNHLLAIVASDRPWATLSTQPTL